MATQASYDREIHPADFSITELEWLTADEDRLGLPPTALEGDVEDEVGVNPNQVMPLLRRVYDLKELERAGRLEPAPVGWCGVGAIVEGLRYYLTDVEAEHEAKKINPNAARPKMGAFDLSGRFHPGMVGGDSDRVRSKWVRDENGRLRKRFYTINLFPGDTTGTQWLIDEVDTRKDGQTELSELEAVPARLEVVLVRDADGDPIAGRITNPIDQHSEEFKPNHRTSINAAWDRMRKHCMAQNNNADMHRALAMNIDVQREEALT